MVIAFIGSAFSPYYAARRRQMAAADPMAHCALNVALYRDGKGGCWSMTERGAAQVQRSAQHLQIGPSALRWDGQALDIHIDEWTVPWPQRLRGRVRLIPSALTPGPLPLGAANAAGTCAHHWWPMAPVADVSVDFDSPGWSWRGSGYLDSNRGQAPLAEGFQRWQWARSHLDDGGAAVTYSTVDRYGQSARMAWHFGRDGRVSAFDAPDDQRLPPGTWGVERTVPCDSGQDPRLVKVLEDSPFYNRALVSSHWCGQPVRAVHESLSLTRFDRRWVQMMLPFRMPRRAGA